MSEDRRFPPPDFALLGHPDSYDHVGDLLLHFRPDFDAEKLRKHEGTLRKFFEWTPSYVSNTQLVIQSGDQTQTGRLIICTFLPEMLTTPKQLTLAAKKTWDGCRMAKEMGAKVIGLGGFTSIVGGAQGEDMAREFQLAITSGNSLTAALAMAQLEGLLERLGWRLGTRTVAILGASGDIGRACALYLVRRARRLVLVGRNQAKLDALRAELPPTAEVYTSTDVKSALKANLIIAATSSAEPLIAEAELQNGTIVCDVGYPKNLAYAPGLLPGVLVFSAGLAEMPFDLDITYYTRLPSSRLMYGCYCEAMVLALARRYESYSIGQGRISLDKMEAILELSRAHGFKPAPLYRGHTPVTDQVLEGFLKSSGALVGSS